MSRTPSIELDQAATLLHQGRVLAYPTEGVWGLGCDPDNTEALQRLLALKLRAPEKGLILIAASIEQFEPWLRGLDTASLERLRASWPAALTWLVPDNGRTHPLVRGEHDRVALRVTPHPLVIALCETFGGPIVSTSANRAGEPSATTAEEVFRAFQGESLSLLDGTTGGRTQPSDIRDLATGKWLRRSDTSQ